MKIKICGITHPDDAEQAASAGADFIGIIFAEHSKRRVSLSMAKIISDVSKNCSAEPVGVFVEHSADQIASICKQTEINTIQLHGSVSQQCLEILLKDFLIIYAISVDKNGVVHHPHSLPSRVIPLYDHSKGGSGMPFNWTAFTPPTHHCWMLAGGLNPENVAEAINLFKPSGVDVSTGVEFPHTPRKNPILVKSFIQAVKNSKERI